MVQALSAPVKEIRHVAIKGLPSCVTDEQVKVHFTKFGAIQRLHRSDQIIFISFMDAKAAAQACKSERYDENISYRITFYNPEVPLLPTMSLTMPDHPPDPSPTEPELNPEPESNGLPPPPIPPLLHSQPSTSKESISSDAPSTSPDPSSIPGTSSQKPMFDEVLEMFGPHSMRTSERSGPPHKAKRPRDIWDPPNFEIPFSRHEKLRACVVFQVKLDPNTTDHTLFEEVKFFVRNCGNSVHIDLEQTTESCYRKAKVYFSSLNLEQLKREKGTILHRPPRYRVYFQPQLVLSGRERRILTPITNRNGSTGYIEASPEVIMKSFLCIHVPTVEGRTSDDYRDRYSIYGDIVDVTYLESSEKKQKYTVVQFTNPTDAANALRDLPQTDGWKPMVSSSCISPRLMFFYLPSFGATSKQELKKIIEKKLYALSRKIIDIEIDYIESRAVCFFQHRTDAVETFKKLKAGVIHFDGNRVVGVDYCSDKVQEYFLRNKYRVRTLAYEDARRKDEKWIHDYSRPLTFDESGKISKLASTLEKAEAAKRAQAESNGGETASHPSTSDHSRETNSHSMPDGALDSKFDDMDACENFSNPSTSSPHRNMLERKYSTGPSNFGEEDDVRDVKREFSPDPPPHFFLPDNMKTKVINKMHWKNFDISRKYPQRIEDLQRRNFKSRLAFEKLTGRHMPRFTNEDMLKTSTVYTVETRDHTHDFLHQDFESKAREWRRIADSGEIDEMKSFDARELLKVENVSSAVPPVRVGNRPSLDETARNYRLSFDSNHHPLEMVQRSQSLALGPMTPATPFHDNPLLVQIAHQPGTSSQPAEITTSRSSQHVLQPSPVSRHSSMSLSGRPANIQAIRHHSVMALPDFSQPPPAFPSTPRTPSEDPIHAQNQTARRSSETLPPLRSPPFGRQNQHVTIPTATNPVPLGTIGGNSVSSSTTSTPRHSISAGAGHAEPLFQKSHQQNPKSVRSEKGQVRHDSILKPGPSTAASALQARSQSMSAGEQRKNIPATPVVRDAGSDLIDQIMSNAPPMTFKKLPRIEKKSSALSVQNTNHSAAPSTLPSSSTSSSMFKDKEREKERRRKERELEREREARKEMKRKETKEERHKRKEMERLDRARKDEEERRERKKEKQRLKEKEERRKEKEKERKRAEKEKMKKKKVRKDSDSDDSNSTSADEVDLDSRKSAKEMTQEEKDHQLAIILSKGSIIENLKSRRQRPEKKGNDSFEKLRQKNQNSVHQSQRRVLIESSDEDDDGEDDNGKEKSEDSSDSENEPRFSSRPSVAPPVPVPSKEFKSQKKTSKEREKGELSSSSDGEHEDRDIRHGETSAKENRKRQKSLTNYSSDDQKKMSVKRKRLDSDEKIKKRAFEKDEVKQRKRKMEQRHNSEDHRHKPKRDFRDVPLEDVSDEEEVEEVLRNRRPSTSSTTSDAFEKKEKTAKTSLRVETPSDTPLMSPKILSPKTSAATSIKRPSISDQESWMSPRQRDRTTSSTSTATTTSRSELAAPEKEKVVSPPITAKSSVSSIDDMRDELSQTSAAASPMSTSDRPRVVTKAAMKVFVPSPKKRLNNPTGSHESSTDSSSSMSSSSCTSSSDDSSDEDVQQSPSAHNKSVVEEAVIAKAISSNGMTEKIDQSNSRSSSLGACSTPSDPLPHSSRTDPSDFVETNQTKTTPVVSPLNVMGDSITTPTERTSSPQHQLEPYNEINERSEEPTPGIVPAELSVAVQPENSPPVAEEQEKLEKSLTEKLPNENAVHLVSPTRVHLLRHTVISDQETEQAVQSIFDEEENDDFPEYPDFILPKERKDSTDKESTSDYQHKETSENDVAESIERHGESDSNHSERKGYNADSPIVLDDDEPTTCTYQNGPIMKTVNKLDADQTNEEKKDTSMQAPSDHMVVLTEDEMALDVAEEQEVETEEDEIMDVEKVHELSKSARESIIHDSPGRTPPPALIPKENPTSRVSEHSISIKTPQVVNNHQYQQVQAPVQPMKPIEVSFSHHTSATHSSIQQHQVVQPSPRHAAAPDTQSVVGQPVSVVQNPEKQSPRPDIQQLNIQQLNNVANTEYVTQFVEKWKDQCRNDAMSIKEVAYIQNMLGQALEGNPAELRALNSEFETIVKTLIGKQDEMAEAAQHIKNMEEYRRFQEEQEENSRRLDGEKKKNDLEAASRRLTEPSREEEHKRSEGQGCQPEQFRDASNWLSADAQKIIREINSFPNGTRANGNTRPSSVQSIAGYTISPASSVISQQPLASSSLEAEHSSAFREWFYAVRSSFFVLPCLSYSLYSLLFVNFSFFAANSRTGCEGTEFGAMNWCNLGKY